MVINIFLVVAPLMLLSFHRKSHTKQSVPKYYFHIFMTGATIKLDRGPRKRRENLKIIIKQQQHPKTEKNV